MIIDDSNTIINDIRSLFSRTTRQSFLILNLTHAYIFAAISVWLQLNFWLTFRRAICVLRCSQSIMDVYTLNRLVIDTFYHLLLLHLFHFLLSFFLMASSCWQFWFITSNWNASTFRFVLFWTFKRTSKYACVYTTNRIPSFCLLFALFFIQLLFS